MTDVIVDRVELVISNAVSSLAVETNQGPAGPRGNYTFVNMGNPTTQTSLNNGNYYLYGNLLIANDIYIQRDTMVCYQFKSQPGGMAWVRIGEDLPEWQLQDAIDEAEAAAAAAQAAQAVAEGSTAIVKIYAAAMFV